MKMFGKMMLASLALVGTAAGLSTPAQARTEVYLGLNAGYPGYGYGDRGYDRDWRRDRWRHERWERERAYYGYGGYRYGDGYGYRDYRPHCWNEWRYGPYGRERIRICR